MDIIVNSVGDANCILIKSNAESMMIDCGVNHKYFTMIEDQFIGAQFMVADYFLLSHYHDDHYDLIRNLPICKKNILKGFYYPIIPKIVSATTNGGSTLSASNSKNTSISTNILTQCIMFMRVLSHRISIPLKNYGSPAANILAILNKKCNHINRTESLYIGKLIKLGSEVYEVIWPPKEFTKSKGGNGIPMPKTITDNIDYIFKELEKNDKLKEIWDELGEYTKDDMSEGNTIIEESKIKKIINIADGISDQTKETVIGYAQGIANSISVCLYKECDLLFLGDLEDADIKKCIDYKFNKLNNIDVTYFITPHHGTHWNNILNNVKAEEAVISIGEGLYKHIKANDYKKICNNLHITFDDKMFIRCSEDIMFDIMRHYKMLDFYNKL